MKRFILEINENEKNRILSMHNNARSILFEQENVSQEGGEKYSKEVMIPTTEDAKTLKSGGGQTAVNNLITKATKNNGSADFNSSLVSSYGELYTSFIQGLSKSPYKSKNADIWYLQLTQDSRITFLNQWKAYLETANKKIQKGKQEVKITLIEGKKTTEKVDLPTNVTTKPAPTTVTKEFNEIGKGKNVYIDNKSDVTPFIQGEIDYIISEITKKTLNDAKQAGATVICTNLSVAASSSRLRNTGEAENITWYDLSKKRAENVKNLLVSKLEGIGINVPQNVILLKGGYNGDGTSGPNPPKKDTNGKEYTITTDGTKNTIQKDEKLRVIPGLKPTGTPHTDINDYLQYKFCIIDITLETIWNALPEDVKKFETIVSNNFTMEIKPVVELGQAKIPSTGFGGNLLPGPSKNTKRRSDLCPAFGG